MDRHAEPYRQEASGIADRLLDRERVSPQPVENLDVRNGLYVEDVRQETAQFRADAETLRSLGLPFPAIRFEQDSVPIALGAASAFPGSPIPLGLPYTHPVFAQYLHEVVREWERQRSERQVLVPVDRAVDEFKSGLTEFLATRIATVVANSTGSGLPAAAQPQSLNLARSWLGNSQIKTVGFKVTVHSSPGLRIHVSPSFRVNWRVFGSPSTPTTGTLPGAIYLFAADGPPYPTITPDSGKFDIPYKTVSPKLAL